MRLLILTAVACAGTADAASWVTIKVKTPPELDPSLFKRVAVLPFDGEDDEGLLAAKALREALEKKDLFLVEPADTVQKLLDLKPDFDPADREEALALGRELGVDLVLVGDVRFYERSYSDQGYVGNELYTSDRGTIPPFEMGSGYTQSTLDLKVKYSLEFTVKALAVKSGRLARRREFEATTPDAYVKAEVSGNHEKENDIYNELLAETIKDFTYTLETHDVEAEREIVDF